MVNYKQPDEKKLALYQDPIVFDVLPTADYNQWHVSYSASFVNREIHSNISILPVVFIRSYFWKDQYALKNWNESE